MAIVYLSLGSNLGDRVGYLQQATSLLGAAEQIKIVTTSSFYESEPWQMNSENWFVNAIVQISTTLSPEALLKECQRIETQLGRKRFADTKGYSDRTACSVGKPAVQDVQRIQDERADGVHQGKRSAVTHNCLPDRWWALSDSRRSQPC